MNLRPLGHVHARRSFFVYASYEVLVNGLAQERNEGRHEPVHDVQALVERQVRSLLVVTAGCLPESPPVEPDVPVTELIDEILDCRAGRLCVVCIERIRGCLHGLLQQGDDPTVYLGTFIERHVPAQIDLVEPGVHDEEAVGVPERVEEAAGDVRHDID